MKIALIDNGSLAAAAQRQLRAIAGQLTALVGPTGGRPISADQRSALQGRPSVEAVSWKHSETTLAPWLRRHFAAGEREFLFIPFFVSPQGAIGSALRADVEALRGELGYFDYGFTEGLGGRLTQIVADRIRQIVAAKNLHRPPVIVVDHGGPSPASADVRDRVAAEVRDELGALAGPLSAASMGSPDGPEFAFNRPLLAQLLGAPAYSQGDVVIAPLFLLPGRHAGPGGDLERIAREAEAAHPGLRCHFTELVGTHPLVVEILNGAQ